ncbi:hypothetical protein SNEBB_002383 [Seison nebaliae]|nr:hypothetical protein SNEBB_002383 [Seison nebaliae]
MYNNRYDPYAPKPPMGNVTAQDFARYDAARLEYYRYRQEQLKEHVNKVFPKQLAKLIAFVIIAASVVILICQGIRQADHLPLNIPVGFISGVAGLLYGVLLFFASIRTGIVIVMITNGFSIMVLLLGGVASIVIGIIGIQNRNSSTTFSFEENPINPKKTVILNSLILTSGVVIFAGAMIYLVHAVKNRLYFLNLQTTSTDIPLTGNMQQNGNSVVYPNNGMQNFR